MYKVLIVDDNIDDINGLLKYVPWESLNCCVRSASNGEEGLKLAIHLNPDIIITDISMPVMDGIEMTKAINEQLNNVYYIYMSCFDDFDFAISAIEYGICAYILKPIDIDEFVENITKIIDKIEEKKRNDKTIEEYRKQVEKSHDILTEKFFSHLLIGASINKQILNEQAEFLDIDTNIKYRMIVFYLEYPLELNDTQNAYTSSFMLKDFLTKKILNHMKGYCVSYEFSITALILADCNINTDEMITQFYDIQELFYKQTQKNFTVCISDTACRLSDLSFEFRKLINIVKYNHFSKNGSIIISNEIDSGQYELETIITSEIYSEISALFSSNDNASIDRFINKYYDNNAKLGEVYIKALSFHIISAVNILLIEQNESFANIFDGEILIWEKLVNIKTIANIKQWLKNILIITKEHLKEKTNNKYYKIISAIKKNIDENFDKLQTLDEVVDNLFISSGYANKLFREYTNQTIYDYLLDKRMSEAKKLLKCSKYKLYEIGEMVGYKSNTYFTTAFKKYTGLTPKEYRSTLLKNNHI